MIPVDLKRASVLALMMLAAGKSAAGETPLESAMRAELARAKTELKAKGYPGVYFAALNVWDIDDWDRWSAMGAPRAEVRMNQRVALAEVRVGSPSLDNHPAAPRGDYLGVPVSMSDDEFSLRHSLWRIFDGVYKTATVDFLRKQEILVSQGRAEYDTDDLALEPPSVRLRARPASPWDKDLLSRLEDAVSEPLRTDPSLLSAEAHAGLRRVWMRRRDTDGVAVDEERDQARIEIEASALAPDGVRETVARNWSARAPEGFPTAEEMRQAGREMLVDLKDLRSAVSTSPFSAPALLDPSVSAALVFSLGQRLSGEEQRNPSGAQTFRGRVGRRVVSEELSLVDDPTLASFQGKPLFGHYEFDDQGVPARRVSLIERGILKGFLLSRYPVKGFPLSNGHGRAPVGQIPTGVPGVLRLTGADPRTVEALLARLRAECRGQGKPFGLWLRNLRVVVQQQAGAAQGSIRFMGRLDLIPADGGSPIRVRDLDMVGTPLVMAESVIASGDDERAFEAGGAVPASVIAPSLLLSEVELQRSESKPETSPILPPPPSPPPPPLHSAVATHPGPMAADR